MALASNSTSCPSTARERANLNRMAFDSKTFETFVNLRDLIRSLLQM